MEIKRNGSRPSAKAPEAYFTGAVRVDPLFQVGDPAREWRQRHLRAGRAHRVAHASAWPDADRHVGLGLGPDRGRTDRGNPARRCRLVSSRREALARRNADDRNDAHRHHGISDGKNVDWLEKVSDEQYRR